MKNLFTLIFLFQTLACFPFNDPSALSKVDPALLKEFNNKSEVEYVVVLKDKLVLEGTLHFNTKLAKGNYVYNMLKAHARKTQEGILHILKKEQVEYHAFWVVNAIRVKSDIDMVRRLAVRKDVEAIISNAPFYAMQTPIIERYNTSISSRNGTPEWGIRAIHADSVWSTGNTGQGVVIAGQDTGYEWALSPIKSRYRGYTDEDHTDHNYNWFDAIHHKQAITIPDSIPNPCGFDSKEPCDDHNHGTHTMGTMVGQDDENSIGVAPGARWIACRNMDRGWGSITSYIECFEWFIAPTALDGTNPDPSKAPHVINNSWYCNQDEGCNLSNFGIMEEVVKNVKAAGIVVVVSAGNDGYLGCGSINGPAAIFEPSFSVGATGIDTLIAGFSSRGPVTIDSSFRLKPNVVAPGVNVRSIVRGGKYANFSGTSMAGPHVAGLVALMISANPKLAGEVEVIEDIIESTCLPLTSLIDCAGFEGDIVPNAIYGYGLVDAWKAVERAKSYIPVSVQDISANIRVIPNPVQEWVTFSVEKGNLPIQSIEIYTLDGKQLFKSDYSSGQILQTIDTGNLDHGIYMYRIWVGDRPVTGKLVKM